MRGARLLFPHGEAHQKVGYDLFDIQHTGSVRAFKNSNPA
jgi:hypothetical protein